MAKDSKKKRKKKKKDREVVSEVTTGGPRPFCLTPKQILTVRSFRVHWISADPDYNPVYRLVPIINLFESDAGTRHEGAVAFLQFRRAMDLEGASYDEEANVYRLDYPLEMADSVLTLLGSGSPLEVAYFEQEDRQWADLRTPFLELGDDDEDSEEVEFEERELLEED